MDIKNVSIIFICLGDYYLFFDRFYDSCEKLFLRGVSKKYFVIQTPNRYHPIEFHTKMIFIHWLPKNIFRKILKALGMVSFSKEKNLNLISEKDINKLFKKYKDVVEYKIFKINFLGFTSNFVIIGKIIK